MTTVCAVFIWSLMSLIIPTVPIYEGRRKYGPGFTFSPEDFGSLSSLPLYWKGIRDLSEQAVVAVGYTLGTWIGRNGEKNLSTNLQFLIVLGMAVARPLD